MKDKIVMAMFCIFLIIFSSVNVSALSFGGNEKDDLGEIVLINVANPEDMRISADYVRNKKFPLIIQLTGTTLESFLWGSDGSEELTTLFGGLNIERIHIDRDRLSRYVSGVNEVAPDGGYFVNPDGSVDLGYVKVDIRKIPKEEDLPDRIDLNFTAEIYFDTDSSFSVFGKQDLFLELDSNKDDGEIGSSVWDGRARIVFLEIKGDKATFQVYDGANRKLGGPFTLRPGQQQILRLNDGPAFLDNQVRFKLQGVYGSEKKAELNIYRNGKSIEVTLVEGMNLYSGSDWILEDIERTQVELRNSKTREKVILSKADLGTLKIDVCDGVKRLEVEDNKVFLEEFDFVKGEDFEEKLKSESISFYCSAIDEYKKALEFSLGEESAELKFKIAGLYEHLGDTVAALENYESISSGSELFEDEKIQNKISYISVLVSEEITNYKTLDDGVNVYLKEISSEEKEGTYFDYVEVVDGVRQSEKRGMLNGKSIIKGSGGDWYVDRIRPDEIILVKKYDDKKKEDLKERVDIGENILEKDILIDIKNIKTPYSVVVSAIPGDGRSYGVSHFQVHIPVEKSAIQWTPEQIDNMIEKTHKAIEDLENIMDKLGSFIKGMKAACFGIYSILLIKNSFFKDSGARKQVIEERAILCKKEISSNDPSLPYNRFEDCMEHHVDADEAKIKDLTNIKKETDELFTGFKSTDVEKVNKVAQKMGVDSEELNNLMKYSDQTGVTSKEIQRLTELSLYDNAKFKEEWEGYSDKIDKAVKLDERIKFNEVSEDDKERIQTLAAPIFDSSKQTKIVGMEGQSTIQKVNAKYSDSSGNVYEAGSLTMGKDKFYTTGVDGNVVELQQRMDDYDVNVVEIDGFSVFRGEDDKYYLYDGKINEPYAKSYSSLGEERKLEINKDGKLWIFPFRSKTTGTIYEKIDNDYANYVVVNYGKTGGIQSYTIHNVGPNGEIDFPNSVDDSVVAHILNVGDTRRNMDSGGDRDNSLKLALEIDSKYKTLSASRLNEGKNVLFDGVSYTVSSAASRSIGETTSQCTNYMSKGDCALLYNFCDPVMCPASRFDLGNRWDIDNVVQTGIIGSLFLGMPNWIVINPEKGENIFPPICLTGVHAGLDNVRSKFEGFEDCLQKAKTEGRDVGICNTIKSIYMCEIFWREGLAIFGSLGKLADVISEKVFGIFGGDGWEYTKWQGSWNELKDNVNFFTSEYARSAFASYHARSLGEFGGEICRAAIYGKVPGTGDFIGELLEPDSPYQFTGWFDELEYSDVDQGKSIYRVYYHIYAGRDEDVEFLVYLKGAGLSNLYVTNPERGVRREVLQEGEYADRSYTITGDSGYNTMCIFINGKEYCGFGKVSSTFSSKYLQDMMLEDDLNRKDIDSAEECMPDSLHLTPYLPGVPTPPVPGAGAMSQSGVIRKCAMNDPDGYGSRWVKVGTCGTDEQGNSLGMCYLDYENSADFNDLKKKDEIAKEWIEKQIKDGVTDDSLNEFNTILDKEDEKVDYLIEEIKSKFKVDKINRLLVYPAYYLDSADSIKDSGIYIRSHTKVGDIYAALGKVLEIKKSLVDGGGESDDEEMKEGELSESDYIKVRISKEGIFKSGTGFIYEGGEWKINYISALPGYSFYSDDIETGLKGIYHEINKLEENGDGGNLIVEDYNGERYGWFPTYYFDSYDHFKRIFTNIEKLDFNDYLDINCIYFNPENNDEFKVRVIRNNAMDENFKFKEGAWESSTLRDDFDEGLEDLWEFIEERYTQENSDGIKVTYENEDKEVLVPFYLFKSLDDLRKGFCYFGSGEIVEIPFFELLAQTEELIEEEGLTSETQRSLDALYGAAEDIICSDDDVLNKLIEFSDSLQDNSFIGPLEVEEIQEEIEDVIATPCYLEQGDPTEIISDDFNDLVWQVRNNGINNGVRDKSCNCGIRSECDIFASYLQEYSEQRGINPTLSLSIVIQESECKKDEVSPSGAQGLWQIMEGTFDDKCDDDYDSFDYVKEDVESNVDCGSKILKAKYNEYKNGVKDSWSYENNQDFVDIVDNCINSYPKYENYRGWEAALRGYNGWGCGPGADVGYVDKITTMFNTLEGGLDFVEVEGDYVDCTLFDDDLTRCGEERYCFIKENPWWEVWNEYDCITCFEASCEDIKDGFKCSGDCGLVADCEWLGNECFDS